MLQIQNKLDEALGIKGWTIAELANATGFSERHLHRIKHGESKPRPSTKRKIAGVLGWPITTLFPSNHELATRPATPDWSFEAKSARQAIDSAKGRLDRLFLQELF